MSTNSFGVDFGQKVDLTASIRNILRNYPEGTSILKELVQNADDAGAKVISFCLDKRFHPTKKIASQSLAEFQGPALLVYNNAVFTENDFQSIQRIGDSLKKNDEQKSKIGRFGIGFNSVYHLTDLPSFVSSSFLVMLDPQAKFLPDVNPSNPGKMVDFVSHRSIVSDLSDQFHPYESYGLTWASPFNGTLFRLPLRTSSQASTSLLSKRVISADDAEALLHSLQNEASAMLLFLKNIERIEIKLWSCNEMQPETVYTCHISNMSPALEQRRMFVGEAVRVSHHSTRNSLQAVDYTLQINCHQQDEQYLETWEVCNQLGGEKCNKIAEDPNNVLLRLVPWGGVAAIVDSTQLNKSSEKQTGGLAYCFLPLPVQTGLPVMVNGFFELSSNRRDVWQAGPDMEGDGRTRAEWNICLMRDVISPSYVRLLLRLRTTMGFTNHFQFLWPKATLASPWSHVSLTTLQAVRTEKLLRLHKLDLQDPLSIAKATEKSFFTRNSHSTLPTPAPNVPIDDDWIECHHAVLLPDIDKNLSEHDLEILCRTLIKTKQPVVLCSQEFKHNLWESKTCEKVANSEYTRYALRLKEDQLKPYIPPISDCRFLLKYCVMDLKQSIPSTELNSLPLLPLADCHTGVLRVISHLTYSNSLELTSMGFSVKQARYALSRSDNDLTQACELLTSSSFEISADALSDIFVVCNSELQQIFRNASSTLLDTSSLDISEIEFLSSKHMEMYSNVRPFTADLVPDLLRKALPKECFTGSPVVISELQKLYPDIMTFLQEFWRYASHYPEIIRASVEGAAIVPTRDGLLLPLSRMSNIITQQRADVSVPIHVLIILEVLGGHVLDESLISSASMPPVFWEYIASSSRHGVIQLLDSLCRKISPAEAIIDPLESLSPTQKLDIFSFLSSFEPVSSISASEAKIIKRLSLFQQKRSGTFIQLDRDKVNFAAVRNSDGLSPELFPTRFLNFSTSQDLQLLAYLGVSILSRSQYFTLELLPNASALYNEMPALVELDLFVMLTEFNNLVEEDKKIATALKEYKCVPNGLVNDKLNRRLYQPAELFDPMETELLALLDASFFPMIQFQREDVLIHLRGAGLNSTLDWTGILACARSIELLSNEKQSGDNEMALQRRGTSLLNYLQKNISRLLGEEKKIEQKRSSIFNLRGFFGTEKTVIDTSSIVENLNELLSIRWMPIHEKSLDMFMPWCQSITTSKVAAPRFCRPISDAWICSYSLCLSLNDIHSQSLIKALGWNEIIPINVIAIQLKELSVKYILNCESNLTSAHELQLACERITSLIPLLYQRLNSATPDEIVVIQSILNSHSWIWVGHAFVHPNKVAFNSPFSLAPYLYAVPQDLAVYKRLLHMFGIRQTFNARDYVEVLRQMALETHAIGEPSKTASATALSDEFIDLAVSLVTFLSAEGGGSGFRPLDHIIYVPDSHGKLAISTDLVADDVPWLTGIEYNSARTGIRLCHPHISTKVAQRIGVRSLRLILVDRSVDSLFSDTVSHVEAFGQAESLTGRLRTILDMYPDGNPILAELIQNADDAGASTVKIMIDENTYPTESLMDPSVAPLQGPALIFCNDSKFTESDFRSLARIGQGSKLEKLSATGRFGLGFNSVYHITDTPSFVSGEHLVIFDPHTHFIPGTTPAQPGIRMKFLGNSLKNTFPDQFRPYQHFGCNFESSYSGTLFRFPLRTTSLARKSEISKRSYSIQDANNLLENLNAHLANHLIFLRSVKFIEIYRCCEAECPVLLRRARSQVSNLSAYNDQSLLHYFDNKFSLGLQISENAQQSLTTRDSFYSQLASTPDHKLPSCAYTVHIMTESVDNTSSDENLKTTSIEYLVVTGIRGGQAKRMACDPNNRHLKLVPIGSVAACLDSSPTSLKFPDTIGTAFCFLPLPVQTGLPVHVNAYFELSSNRRDIWRGDDTIGESKIRSEWNVRLMVDLLAPLYVLLLTRLTSQLKRHQNTTEQLNLYQLREKNTGIYALIPSADAPPPWNNIRHTFFSLINEVEVLWSNLNGGIYLSPGKAVVAQNPRLISDGGDEAIRSLENLEEILLLEEVPVVVLPPNLYKSLVDANVAAGVLTPSYVRNHYKLKRPHQSLRPPAVANAAFLLEYCLRDNPTSSDLHGLPLMPLFNPNYVGLIGDPTDPPLYLTSEYERKLLGVSNQSIIADEQTLGMKISSALRTSLFLENCNVQVLTPLITLKLLQYVVPSHWFARETCIVNRYETVDGAQKELITLEWVQGFWSYILETKSLHLLEGMLPIVPVQTPPHLPKGSYLVKFSFSIPILHMSIKEMMNNDVFRVISSLGLYILDSSALGSSSYSQDLLEILCEPSPKGVLNSLYAIRERVPTVSPSWNENIRDALRLFLLDSILAKIDSLSPEHIEFLQMVPVFESEGLHSERKFCSLKSEVLLLIPPRHISKELLTPQFVKLRDDKDRAKFSRIGLHEPSTVEFYSVNVLPSIPNNLYSDSTLSLLSVELLRVLPSIEPDNSTFVSQLRSCAFLKNSKGVFCCPDLLYDPHAPYLASILPPDAFPCPKLYQDGTLFSALRLLGLCSSLNASGILRAVESIHHDFVADINEGNNQLSEKTQRALQRSVNLIRYLDLNIDSLCTENTEWTIKLRDLVWVPVWIDPPTSSRIASVDPPWPTGMHRSPLARPTLCVLPDSIWLCSTTHRIVKFEPQNDSLIRLLGWNSSVSGRSATSQLLSLIDMHTNSQSVERMSEVCYQVMPRIYSALATAIETESDVEIEIWSRSLQGKPFVWISGLFVEPNRISFTPLSSINTEPYLFVAKGELTSYRPLLLHLGVQEAFGVKDLIALLGDISASYGSRALPAEKIDMCLGIVKIICQISSREKFIARDGSDHSIDGSTGLDREILLQIRESIGDIFIPDRVNTLVLAKYLSYDDAPWMSSQLSSRGIRFVHRGIDNESAFLLGANSLREQLFSGDAIVCPDCTMVRDIIGNDNLEDSLGDLIGLADKLACSAVHLVLDEISHPCESLIHPGLALAQGPSILVFLEGVTVSVEELTQLLLSPSHLETPVDHRSRLSNDAIDCKYNAVGKKLHSAFAVSDCLQVLSGNHFYVFDPCGNFLIGSGEDRETITSRSRGSTNGKSQSKAQKYALNGKDHQSMLSRFPDQFKGFHSLPLIIDDLCNGTNAHTILRLPLRSESSAISSNTFSPVTLGRMLHSLVPQFEGSLIFSHFLQKISVQRCAAISHDGLKQNESLELRLVDAANIHFLRRKIISDVSWKKGSGLFLWKQPTASVDTTFRACIEFRHACEASLQPVLRDLECPTLETQIVPEWSTEWIVRCLQGVETNRNMALKDPFKRMELQPFVSLAAPVSTPSQLQNAIICQHASKFSRYIYCNSGCLGGGPTGFPFHIDGSFLMNNSSRGLSLVESKIKSNSNMFQIIPLDLLHQWNSGLFLGALEILAPVLLLEVKDAIARASTELKEMRFFYTYWPYVPRILPNLATHYCKSKLLSILASKELFLTRNGFESLGNNYLSMCCFPDLASQYLQANLNFCDVPSQVVKDLLLSQIRVNSLTPPKLRELLKSSGVLHSRNLNRHYEIVLPLLKYCLSDIERNSTDGEFVRRKTYREIAGCPLLFMADRSIRCFPTNPREQVIIAPSTILSIMPSLRSFAIHPIALRDADILGRNSTFKDALHIVDLSPHIIKVLMSLIALSPQEHARLFVPQSWERCYAIDWSQFIKFNEEIVSSERSRVVHQNEVSDLFIYILWRDVLHQCEYNDLLPISTFPLLPVIAGETRILMTPTIISYLLNTASITSSQENARAQLRRETGRLQSLVDQDIASISCSHECSRDKSLFEEFSKGNFERQTSTENLDDLGIQPTVVPPPNTTNNERIFDTFSSPLLGEALKLVRMPLIDGGIFEDMPMMISSAFRSGERFVLGHKILKCLSYIESEHVVLHAATSNDIIERGPLLRFDLLTMTHRKILLLEIIAAHHERRLTEAEIYSLKTLPLFTSIDDTIITIANCNGVYWCESESALNSLSKVYHNSTISESSQMPTVLIADPDLRNIYDLIGAEELTPQTVVKKFMLPSLDKLEGLDRLRIMQDLSVQWDLYRGDTQLLQLLKAVAFVPAYQESVDCVETKQHEYDLSRPFRRSDQLFSWNNRELFSALAGSHQNEYFPPPELRIPRLHQMMIDLGMPQDLDKDALLRVATDIQKTANKFRVDQREDCITEPGGPRDRGLSLLRYLKAGDRSASLFDINLARRLGKISFVPVLIPTGVEAGGYVIYKSDICRFEQTLASNKGFLGFTCLPVLSEDISPPQSFYSALGITSSPTIEVVLRHIRNLTSSGDSLDRWNSMQYPIKDTFGELFTFLHDNWKNLSGTIQTALETTNIVPIGHSLYKPRRLFFRLAEDLNPFMHEIPRYFGQHEQFLKKIGVREKPSSDDYCQFLIELAAECKSASLNPNELRAIIAILDAINSEVEVETASNNSSLLTLYLPDEDSILRESSKCVYNDDSWLRSRLGFDGISSEIYILHPLVTEIISLNLNIPFLSSVLVECMPEELMLQIENAYSSAKSTLELTLRSRQFIEMMTNLCVRTKAKTARLKESTDFPHHADNHSDIESAVSWKLGHLSIVFVEFLATIMQIKDPRQHGRSSRNTEPMPSLCFVKFSDDGQPQTLYINCSMLSPPISSEVATGVGICRLLGLDTSMSASISLLLASIQLGDSDRVYSELRVASDTATIRERTRGQPGAQLTEPDRKMIELKPYRVYRIGEIVAYEKEDPVKNARELFYGRIVAISDEGEAGVRKISVKTDSGVITYLPTDIFSFRSARDTVATVKSQPNLTERKSTHSLFSTFKMRSSSEMETTNSLPIKVPENPSLATQNDVVGALQSLLIRAGIPVSLESSDLVARILELESEKKKLESTLLSERSLLNEAQESIQRIKSTYSCQICLGPSVTHVMTPCGHTICGECLGRMQSNKCPFCRSNITHRVKLFFSQDEEQDENI